MVTACIICNLQLIHKDVDILRHQNPCCFTHVANTVLGLPLFHPKIQPFPNFSVPLRKSFSVYENPRNCVEKKLWTTVTFSLFMWPNFSIFSSLAVFVINLRPKSCRRVTHEDAEVRQNRFQEQGQHGIPKPGENWPAKPVDSPWIFLVC